VNVVRLPREAIFSPGDAQVIEQMDYADFCALLEAESYSSITVINGLTILSFPRAAVICNGAGVATSITALGTSISLYVSEAHEKLELNAAA